MAGRRRRANLAALEKKELWRRWREGQSLAEIGRGLGIDGTCIRRVVRTTGGFTPRERRRSRLSLTLAEREEISRGVAGGETATAIARRLPEQISGWLVTEYPDDPAMRISAETIYRSLFIQARGVLKKELPAHLRGGRTLRGSRHATKAGQGRGEIVDAVSIRERPPAAEDRAIPGHWEGDLCAVRATVRSPRSSSAVPGT